VTSCGISLENALKMATLTPAKAMGIEKQTGYIRTGLSAHHLVAVNLKDFKCTLIAPREEKVVKIE